MSTQKRSQVYLVVADDTPEFEKAWRYAIRAARANNARVSVLYVIQDLEFSTWVDIEERMKAEQRQKAEAFLSALAEKMNAIEPGIYGYFLEYGKPTEAIVKVLQDNPMITRMILSASSHSGNPGPLVSYFAGKGVSQLTVPLTMVPDHLSPDEIDHRL